MEADVGIGLVVARCLIKSSALCLYQTPGTLTGQTLPRFVRVRAIVQQVVPAECEGHENRKGADGDQETKPLPNRFRRICFTSRLMNH